MDSTKALPKTPKHVIFLGAGASFSSGYPLASDLRIRMASPDAIWQSIKNGSTFHAEDEVHLRYRAWIQQHENALKLFREGTFSTVDEFCKLAGRRFADEIAGLKKVLRLVLGSHNPEDKFEKSDYYAFVQRLFLPNLHDLRDDIIVISFNYDVYLDYLLSRAHRIRNSIKTNLPEISKSNPDCLTSGFANRNTKVLEESDGFCFLKLHGSIAWPTHTVVNHKRSSHCSYNDFFGERMTNRLTTLISPNVGNSDSPIVFPWEIIADDNSFINETDFSCHEKIDEQGLGHGGYIGNISLFHLFKSIWTRARAEVQSAGKVSFVGLSMHEYLTPALKYLFAKKTGVINLVNADDWFKNWPQGTTAHFDPLSPAARIEELLKKICPKLRWNEPVNTLPERNPLAPHQIRVRGSFAEFILKEMNPLTPMVVNKR